MSRNSGTDDSRPLIVAHRGSSRRAPENTWPAFELAAAAGADGIEMDVRLAADGVPVVFHDATLKRFTGKEVAVRRLTSKEMSTVPVGSWFNHAFPEAAEQAFERVSVPTLESVLDRLKGFKGVVYIELKCGTADRTACAEAVAAICSSSRLAPNLILKSFDLDVLPVVKKVDPELRTAALFASEVMSIIRKEKRLVNIAKDLDAGYLSVHSSLATKKLIRKARENGLGVAVWTVDHPRWIRRAIDLGIETLITNRPEEMMLRRREVLHRNSITA